MREQTPQPTHIPQRSLITAELLETKAQVTDELNRLRASLQASKPDYEHARALFERSVERMRALNERFKKLAAEYRDARGNSDELLQKIILQQTGMVKEEMSEAADMRDEAQHMIAEYERMQRNLDEYVKLLDSVDDSLTQALH